VSGSLSIGLERADFDTVVVGGGAAGVSAALYLGRAGYTVALLERGAIGGQIAVTDIVENYAGIPSIRGPDLAANFARQLEKWRVIVLGDEATNVREGEIITVGTYARNLGAKCVIIATGSSPRRLGIEGETKFIGRGLSFCAFCDAEFFRDKDVAVIGGGDSALKEASYLSRIVSRVYLIHRRGRFRAESANVQLIDGNPKVEKVMNSNVIRFLGHEQLEGLVVRDSQTQRERELKVEGAFEYIGRVPNTSFLQLAKDPADYLVVDENMMTSLEGVFAAGECTSPKWNQLIVSAGEGAKAAISAVHYLDRKQAGAT
jgi:thioredoxin reductase (NADPH)